MKTKFFSFFFLLFSVLLSFGQTIDETLKALKKDISYLASDALQGRETGTFGADLAANYLVERFTETGLLPKGDNQTFLQVFQQKPKGAHGENLADTVKEITVKNIIGYIDNHAENTIVVGAHYDHLGFGEKGSLNTGEKAIHNGADDNASGIAAIIQIAQWAKQNVKNYNLLIIAFSGEEKGLWGSNYFTKNPTLDLSKVNYMINLDMVGRLTENKLAIYGTGTSPAWNNMLKNAIPDSIKLTKTESGVGPSDHTSFYLKNIPVLHFFTGQHADYHKPSDDVEKINFNGIVAVIDFIQKIISLSDNQSKLTFTKTKEDDKAKTPAFKVTLGVMPDYMYSEKGMRIDGVREGKPAATAGLQAGDIVLKIGKNDISDMQSYMQTLSLFNPGDKAKITFLRNGKKKKAIVVF